MSPRGDMVQNTCKVQIAFICSLICTSTRWNQAALGTNQGD
jgi:hypothetical protein